MKAFYVPISWTMTGTLTIFANDKAEAIERAGNVATDLCSEGEYVLNSFTVDDELVAIREAIWTSYDDIFGDLLTMKEFISAVRSGELTDYDGVGRYATKEKISDISIHPSEVLSGYCDPDATHIMWYNKWRER